MADIRLDDQFARHPKTVKLARAHGAEGVLCLLRIWLFAAANRPRGRLEGLAEDDLEIIAEWNSTAGELVKTLVELRFLDRDGDTFALHNWERRQPWLAGAPSRQQQARAAAAARWERTGADEKSKVRALRSDSGGVSPTATPTAAEAADAKQATSKVAARRIQKSKRTWPADLALDAAMRTFAAQRGVDPELEFEAWRADCAAHDRKYVDWPAAWRTRILNAPRFGGGARNEHAHKNGAAMPPTIDELISREKERPA